MEQWKNIEGYEGIYLISSEGRIFSVQSNRTLKTSINNSGYGRVELFKERKMARRLMHRLVAQAFIPNPENFPIINHKDENPSNNRVENLEWCTHAYNTNYGNCIAKIKANAVHKKGAENRQSKTVYQFDLQGNFIKEFGGVHEASRQTGFDSKSIAKCGTGHLKTYGGYVWKYENKFSLEPKKCTPRKGAVLMFDMNHNLLKRYEFSRETAKDGFRPNDVCRCCRGERRFYADRIWEYATK